MDGYSLIALLTVIGTVFALWKVRKPKDQKPSLLDTSGIILNLVLVMIYPALTVAAALLGIDRFATVQPYIFLEGAAIAMGRLMPAICVAGIGASVVLRRKGKSGLSFLVQFSGGIWFCITMLLAKFSGSY